jgi:hypothetical protein
MAQDVSQKAARVMADALADSRFNAAWFINMVSEAADGNDMVQRNLFLVAVAYHTNRTMLWDLGLGRTEMQNLAGEVSSNIVHNVYSPANIVELPNNNVPAKVYGTQESLDLNGWDKLPWNYRSPEDRDN